MEPATGHQGTEKPDDVQAIQGAAASSSEEYGLASPWIKRDEPGGSDAPALPPVWTRYIDSRLKQFCTR